MNFQYIHPIDNSKQLLEIAFRKAREKVFEKRRQGDFLQDMKIKDMSKFDMIKDILNSRLDDILDDFPQERALPDFYLRLLHVTVEYAQYKKSLGAVHWAKGKVAFMHREYARKLSGSRNYALMSKVSKEFYGRVSSIVKQIDPNLKYLEQCRNIMKTYPDIKELFTVCIYGFPNVGKTTLLNKLTGAQAKVASYAFTTQTINSGFVTLDGIKIQVLDVPGTLARDDKMNLIEIQAELVRKELANIIVYVFDVTESSGYSLEKQEQLFKKLGKDKKVLVYLSKQDIASPEQLKDLKHDIVDLAGLKEQIKALAAKTL
jgi:nucleolar GTP-binding protein